MVPEHHSEMLSGVCKSKKAETCPSVSADGCEVLVNEPAEYIVNKVSEVVRVLPRNRTNRMDMYI